MNPMLGFRSHRRKCHSLTQKWLVRSKFDADSQPLTRSASGLANHVHLRNSLTVEASHRVDVDCSRIMLWRDIQ